MPTAIGVLMMLMSTSANGDRNEMVDNTIERCDATANTMEVLAHRRAAARSAGDP